MPRSTRYVRWITAATVVLSTLPIAAQTPPQKSWTDLDIRISPLVILHNHGYFRFRFNEFYRMDLGYGKDAASGGVSGFPQTLDATSTNSALSRSRATVESADIRFRYEPRLTVGEFLSVNARIDMLDNLVMGSTPSVGGTANSPFSFFSDAQKPPSDGVVGFRDSLRVKAAWADLRLFERLHLMGGRMPEQFGLGIVRSDGSKPDSDFGDHVDAVFFKLKLSTTYFRVGMEWPGEGATSESPFRYSGPPHDADQSDDITRWVFLFDSSPVEKEDFEERDRILAEHKPVMQWGMYHSLTSQKLSSDRIGGFQPTGCGQDPFDLGSGKPFFDCYTLTPRGAFFWTPALWGRLLWNPLPNVEMRFEAEVAMVYGGVDYLQSFPESGKKSTRRSFFSVGGAFEGEARVGNDRFSLFAGAATGDSSSRRFGVLDKSTLATADDSKYSIDPGVSGNASVRNFIFNPDYRLDSILFREVIGAVTNAFYFKPAYRRTVLRAGPHSLALGASLLAAFAAVPEGTPGGRRPLGIEPGLDVGYRMEPGLTVSADGAVLFPLSGLKSPILQGDPKPASALRLRMVVEF